MVRGLPRTFAYPRDTFVTGSLVGLRVLRTRIVVLNSHEAMVELLEKRGNNYSHRPIFTVLGELMNLNKVRMHHHIQMQHVLMYSRASCLFRMVPNGAIAEDSSTLR